MKKLLCSLVILLFAYSQSFAAYEWRAGTGANTILGTSLAADIDANSYQSIVAPLDRVLSLYRRGAQITYASTTTLTVGIGEVVCSNAAGTVRKFRANTSATTVDTSGASASTTYYVYAIADADTETFTCEISTSSTTPTGTYYRRLGSFYNNSSSNVTLISDDDISSNLGDWVSKSASTTYQASSDGFVVAYMGGVTVGAGDLIGLSDGSSSPTTVIAKEYLVYNSTENVCITFPVAAGNYYKVYTNGNGTITEKWIPLQ